MPAHEKTARVQLRPLVFRSSPRPPLPLQRPLPSAASPGLRPVVRARRPVVATVLYGSPTLLSWRLLFQGFARRRVSCLRLLSFGSLRQCFLLHGDYEPPCNTEAPRYMPGISSHALARIALLLLSEIRHPSPEHRNS